MYFYFNYAPSVGVLGLALLAAYLTQSVSMALSSENVELSALAATRCSPFVPRRQLLLGRLPRRRRPNPKEFNVTNEISDVGEHELNLSNTQWIWSCNIHCDALANENTTTPFAWDACPHEPLHLDANEAEIKLSDMAPRIKLASEVTDVAEAGDWAPQHGESRVLRSPERWRYGERRESVFYSSGTSFSVGVQYVNDYPSENYIKFPIGKTAMQFQAVVTENTCREPGTWNYRGFKQQNSGVFSVGSTLLTCSINVIVHDTEPPAFTFCPGHREFHLSKGTSKISFRYDRPLATDNSNFRPTIRQVT